MTESTTHFGILEVLSRSGKVVQRAELDRQSLTVGRSYENDIILDDHFVCPEHLSVSLQGSELLVEDLNSVNGLFQNKFHVKGGQINIASNETFRIGHTLLRYRSSQDALAPTKIDRHAQSSFWSLQNPWLILIIALIFTAFVALEAVYAQLEELDGLKVLSESLSALLVVACWAGLWALFGKLVVDRPSFLTHFGIFSLANILFSLDRKGVVLGKGVWVFDDRWVGGLYATTQQ